MINTFLKGTQSTVLALDTETYLTLDSVRVTSGQLIKVLKGKKDSWIRKHIKVVVYAWLVSNGKEYANFDNFNDVLALAKKVGCKQMIVYNAKYDFSNIDYYLLTNGWKLGSEKEPFTYNSLNSYRGDRYQLTLYLPKGKKSTYKILITDIYNIFPNNSLGKMLEDFNVKDYEGNNIKKLEMDYQLGNNELYMENDVKGLYHLAMISNNFLMENFNTSILINKFGKVECLTSGSIAKKVLLTTMYNESFARSLEIFKTRYPMDSEMDKYFRDNKLYRGGITLLNSKYCNKILNFPIHKYDFNSMYPSTMRNIDLPKGNPIFVNNIEDFSEEEFIIIYHLSCLNGILRKNMIPIFPNFKEGGFTAKPFIEGEIMIFSEELKLFKKFYDLEYTIKQFIIFPRGKEEGIKKFVDTLYEMKTESKRKKNQVTNTFSKLILNSSYGKLSENPIRKSATYYLNEDNCVRLQQNEDTINDKKTLNIVLGSYITSLSRVKLITKILEICPNPSKDFIYCDTDSIHTKTSTSNIDNYKLGELKLEGIYYNSKYLAPKTYINYNDNENYFFATKGIPSKNIKQEFENKPIDFIFSNFSVGKKFSVLRGFNLQGGKGLLPLEKEICKEENIILEEQIEGDL